jgi:geranylgeranyl diphosphate synthase type II
LNAEQDFENIFKDRAKKVDHFLDQYFQSIALPEKPPLARFQEALKYSLNSGGKRFRPLLAIMTAELFEKPEEKVIPWAAAVEMIHTYSLIHDDLPCMDNDDTRRGKPTNHKVYGEALALLAGDGLLTESFVLVSESYADSPALARHLVSLLAMAAGNRGMVGGQVLDMHAEKNPPTFEELLLIHKLKTAQMIQVPIQGAGLICEIDEPKIEVLRKFGEALGLAFQIADDILDHNQTGQDNRSFTKLLGYNESKSLLLEFSEEALFQLKKITPDTHLLHQMIEYNLIRRG